MSVVESEGRCRDCRHWGEPDEIRAWRPDGPESYAREDGDTGRRLCLAVTDTDHGWLPCIVTAKAFVSSYDGAHLVTRPDFGCVLFEPKGGQTGE